MRLEDGVLVRGKRLGTKEWITGFYFRLRNGFLNGIHYILLEDSTEVTDNTLIKIDPATVCRYTGEHDKTGVRIFTGDFLNEKKLEEFPEEEQRFYIHGCPAHMVVWQTSHYEHCPSFKIVALDGGFYPDYLKSLSERIVIGNVYDNPEVKLPESLKIYRPSVN